MPNIENIEQYLEEIEWCYNESEKARSKLKSFEDPIQFQVLIDLLNGEMLIKLRKLMF